MVMRRDPHEFGPYRIKSRLRGKGHIDAGKPRIVVRFPIDLFKSIQNEAESRGWSMNRMIVHLCEASIEGIE